MDIGSMIEREDFYGILKNTIESYCMTVRNQNVRVSFEEAPGLDKFRIFKLGGIISRPNKPQGALEFLLAEYNVRTNWFEYVAGKVLAYMVYFSRRFGSDRDLFISKGVFGDNELISPQNRSVRFFDYNNHTVDCMIKSGFTEKYFKKQLLFRRTYKYNFLVPVLASGDNWFREPILKGHPLARVTNDCLFKKGIKKTMSYISRLSSDTLTYQDAKTYVHSLFNRAMELTDKATKTKQILSIDNCRKLIEKAYNDAFSIEMSVPLCISHGDLQTGNIWCNSNGQIYIYDWETSEIRSVWYDSATLLYSLRRPYGWNIFYNCAEPVHSLFCDPQKNRSKKEYVAIKGIVLLEDYLFLIEDMLELPDTWGNDIFDGNIKRIYNAIFGKNLH